MERRISVLAISVAVAAGTAGFENAAAADVEEAAAASSLDGDGAADAAATAASVSSGADIVVTAARQNTILSRTPISVTAVDRALIEEGGLQQIRDLEGQVAGLTTPGSIPNMQSSFIRGIGTSDAGGYQAVGIYVDDVYLPRVFGNALFDLLDLKQIEVLRGPQASLYGQNTTAGVIKFVTQDPGDQFRLEGDVAVGDFDYWQTHGLVSGPLVGGTLYASLAYGIRRQGGFIYNRALGRDVNRISTEQVRAKLKYAPGGAYAAVLTADWAEDNSDNATFIPVTGRVPYSDPAYDPREDVPLFGSKRVNEAFHPLVNDNDIKLHRKSGGVSLIQTLDASDALSFKATSAWRYLKDDPSPWDYDGTPAPIRDFVQYIDEHYFYQELQATLSVGSLTLIGGGTYFRERFAFSRYAISARPTAVGYTYSNVDSRIIDENIAGYINATYRFTDRLGVTVGLRYGNERQEYRNLTHSLNASGAIIGTPVNLPFAEDSWNSFTPKITIDFQATDTLFTYLTYGEGQRTGGYDRNASSNTAAAATPTNPEKVKSFEGGLKWRAPSARLNASVALFYNDFHDYISSISNPVVDGVALVGALPINAGRAHTQGAEFEVQFNPTPRWDLRVTGLIVDGEFDESYNDAFTGNDIPFLTPRVFGASVGYHLPTDRAGAFDFHLDGKYVSEFNADISNALAYEIPERVAVNGRLQWTDPSDRFSISANVLNIFDDQSPIRRTGYRINTVVPAQTENGLAYAEPRRFFVQLSYRH